MRDECGLHDGQPHVVDLAVVPFGAARMPHFKGELGSMISIPDDARYSHEYANALTVSCWICPSKLDFPKTDGSMDQYVHLIEKARKYNNDVEWAFRLYNFTNPKRHSRLSFYVFNLGHPTRQGAGAYMEYGVSSNDPVPVRKQQWLFLVGQAEPWLNRTEQGQGTRFFKQGVVANRSPGDKYNNPPRWNIQPQHGPGVITLGGSLGKTAFCGAIAHVAIWNRLLASEEIAQIFAAGTAELLG